jgi:hypothetical protein
LSRKDTFLFIYEHTKKEALRYTRVHAKAVSVFGPKPENKLDREYIEEMLKKKGKWEAAVALMEEEMSFHCRLLEGS